MSSTAEKYMRLALKEAQKAYEAGEVPVGAVVAKDGRVIARAHNMVETKKDPTAHAEMLALRKAAAKLGGWRLIGCEMYVTAEPCSMCAGALVWARIEKLYIGTMDPKAGACGSVMSIVQKEELNHRVELETGILREECADLLAGFFRELRQKKAEEKKS